MTILMTVSIHVLFNIEIDKDTDDRKYLSTSSVPGAITILMIINI